MKIFFHRYIQFSSVITQKTSVYINWTLTYPSYVNENISLQIKLSELPWWNFPRYYKTTTFKFAANWENFHVRQSQQLRCIPTTSKWIYFHSWPGNLVRMFIGCQPYRDWIPSKHYVSHKLIINIYNLY